MTDSTKPEQTGDEADRNAILALIENWHRATRAKDVHAILELVADDVVFLPSSLPPIRGKAEVEQMYRTFFAVYREIKLEAATVKNFKCKAK